MSPEQTELTLTHEIIKKMNKYFYLNLSLHKGIESEILISNKKFNFLPEKYDE